MVQAGFHPTKTKPNKAGNYPVPPFEIPPSAADLRGKFSKKGTLYTRLFLANPFNPVPEAAIFDIHAPNELKFTTKRLPKCDPAAIRNQSAEAAKEICAKALIGSGNAEAWLGGPTLRGAVALFNGTKQNGNPTVLFHSTAGTPVTLVSEMRNSPLPGFGTLFHTLVAQSAGGGVPDGIPIVDTDFTISKKYTDKKLKRKSNRFKKKERKAKKQGDKKKAKKFRRKKKRLKQRSKKTWVKGKCTDGLLVTQINVSYVSGPAQSDTTNQVCA